MSDEFTAVTEAIDARLKQYALDREPLDPAQLAGIALDASTRVAESPPASDPKGPRRADMTSDCPVCGLPHCVAQGAGPCRTRQPTAAEEMELARRNEEKRGPPSAADVELSALSGSYDGPAHRELLRRQVAAISGADISDIRHSDGGVDLARRVVNLKGAAQMLLACRDAETAHQVSVLRATKQWLLTVPGPGTYGAMALLIEVDKALSAAPASPAARQGTGPGIPNPDESAA